MKSLHPIASCGIVFLVSVFAAESFAQKDIVYLNKTDSQRSSRATGRVIASTPDGVTLQDGSQSRDISIDSIRRIDFANQPSALGRARSHFNEARYADCVAELQKITETPSSPFVQREIAFMMASANAEIALRGGDVTANEAGQAINLFIRDNPEAYQMYSAVNLMGRLLLAIGKVDLAQQQFVRLAESKSPKMRLQGLFQKGNAELLLEKWSDAKSSFESIGNLESNDAMLRQYKIAAQCQLARLKAIQGEPAEAKSEIEAIIKSESVEDEMVFAYAYNALGVCNEKLGDPKSAALAYLHNELLFVSQHDARAEALYRLTSIWRQLDAPDSADRARSALLSRYRNSVWANKL